MSFWSSLQFVRSAVPPVVTVAQVGEFLKRVEATGAVEEGGLGLFTCQIKYGPTIDMDEKTTNEIEWDESGTVGMAGEYPWDFSKRFPTLKEMAGELANDSRTIYRLELGLGDVVDGISHVLTREPCEDNDYPLCLCGLGFSLGPVLVAGLKSEAQAFVGWMSLSLSGQGYYFPWTFREARDRAESIDQIRGLIRACEDTWPVSPTPPSKAAIAGRKRLEDLWLYDELDKPSAWFWFPSETG